MMNNKQKNIDNLTSLWETVGTAFNQCFHFKTYSHCQVPNSDWPNRIWFHEPINKDDLKDVTVLIKESSFPLSISYWGDFNEQEQTMFEKLGYSIKSKQVGMSIKLTKRSEQFQCLKLERVTKPHQAILWSDLYPQCFGYRIPSAIINKTQKTIHYYLVYKEHLPVGTAIIYETNGIIGIHGLGILPLFRKQGFAEEVMYQLHNIGFKNDKKEAVLQASSLGKNIYKKVGFTEDFIITNYQLK